jgi:hypothetical protein
LGCYLLPCLASCLSGLSSMIGFHANLLGLNSTWPGPGGENLHNLSIGVRALILVQDNPGHHFHNRQYRSHA